MYKYTLLTFCISFLLLNCSKKKEIVGDIVYTLQQKSQKTTKDSVYYYLKLSEDLINKNNQINDSLKAENNFLLGLYSKSKGNLDSADYYFYKATNYVESPIQRNRASTYFYTAWLSKKNQGKTGDCIALSNTFYNALDEKNDFNLLNFAYYLLQNSYENGNKIDSALHFTEKRIALLKKNNDSVNIIKVSISRAKLLYQQNKVDSTFSILDKILKREELLTEDAKRQLNGQYGVFLYKEGKALEAIKYYKKALKSSKKTKDTLYRKNLVANGYGNLAEAYTKLQKFEVAQVYLDSIYALNFELLNNSNQQNTLNYQLQLSYYSKKDISTILKQLEGIKEHQENTYKEKYSNELIALTEATKNEKLLTKANQKKEIENIKLRNRNILLLLSFLFLLLLGFLLFKRRAYLFEKQSLKLQQRLLRSQMNPHFTFNTLYAIQNSIKSKPQLASDYLLRFSKLLRLIFENSTHNYISLEKEIDLLREYLELQKFRFPNKIAYTIETNTIETDICFIPPMLIQPFVENAIEHGFDNISYTGEIVLNFSISNNFIECIIEDNGTGKKDFPIQNEKVSSIKLIATFIEKTTKTKISIKNKKEQDNSQSGVIVKFNIPYKKTKND